MPLGRKSKWALAIFSGLVALIVLLHTGAGKELVRRGIESAARSLLDGRATLEALDYRLWRGEVDFFGIALEPDLSVLPFHFTSEHIALSVSPSLTFSGTVEGAELVLIDLFETPTSDYTPLLTRIRSVVVRDLAIRFQDHDETGALSEWLAVEDVTFQILRSIEGHRIAFHARTGHFLGESFGAIDADLVMRPGRLQIASATLLKDDSFARMEGDLDFTSALKGVLDVDFTLDGALARLVDDELAIVGVVAGASHVRFEDGEARVDAELRSGTLAWKNVEATDIEAEASFADGALHVERLEVRAFGGLARMAAEIAFRDDARNRFELSWTGLDTASALRELADTSLPFVSRIGGEAHFEISGFALASASGEAHVDFEPGSDILGTLRASLENGVVDLRSESVRFPSYATSLELEGSVTTSGELDVVYTIDASDIGRLAPNTPIAFVGAIAARGLIEGTLERPRTTTELSSDGLRLAGTEYDLSGALEGSRRELKLEDVKLTGKLGTLTARGTVPIDESLPWDVRAALDRFALPGNTLADGDITIFGTASEPDWSASVELRLPDGELSLTAEKRKRMVTLEQLTGTLASGNVDARGSYDLDEDVLDGILSIEGLRASGIRGAPEYLNGLDAVVGIGAQIAGPWRTPRARADIALDDVTLRDVALPSFTLAVVAEGDHVRLEATREDGVHAMRGTVLLSGDFPIHLELPLDAVPISEIAHAFPIFLKRERATWTMSGLAILDVKLSDLSQVAFEARVESLSAELEHFTGRADGFTVSGDAEHLSVSGFELRGERIRLAVDGTYPLVDDEAFGLTVSSSLDLSVLGLLDPELELDGEGHIDLTIEGPRIDPDIKGAIRVSDSAGRYKDVTWSELALSARAHDDRLDDVEMTATLLGGRFTLRGDFPFLESGGAGRLELALEDADFGPLLDEDLSLIATVLGSIEIPAPELAAVRGSGRLERLALRAEGGDADLSEPASWTIANGVLSMPPFRLDGARSHLTVGLTALALAKEPDFDISAEGTLDLRFANAWIDARGVRVGGVTELEIAASRQSGELSFRGQGRLTDGRFASVDPDFSFADGEAEFHFDDAIFRLDRLDARSGTGRLHAEGTVDFSEVGRLVVDLAVDVGDVPLEVMDGLRAEVSGNLRLTSAAQELSLRGNLTVGRGLLTRELEDNDASFSAQSMVFSDPTAPAGPFDRLALGILITTEQNVRVENSMAQLEAAGSISVGGTLAAPEIGGFVTFLPDGTFNIARNRFQVISGRLDLTGFPAIPPNVRLTAMTRVGTTVIHVDIEGDADDLRTQLTAPESPDLTEGDLASLLVTGRTLENAGEGGQQIASTWMMSSLANLVHEGLGDLISFGPPSGAGPIILAEEADPTSRLTLGFPVTTRMSITYSIALDNSERRLWILDYRIARNVWLRAIQKNSSDYSFGLSQRFNLDFRHSARAETTTSAARVSGVSFQGASPELVEKIKLRSGERYDYWKIRDAAAKLEADLVEDGYKSAVVDFETHADERGDVDVTFVVNTGLPTEFSWQGDDPGKEVKKLVERSWQGRIPEAFQLTDLVDSSTARLKADRYYLAQVLASVEPQAGKKIVRFEVTRGPRGDKVRLSFTGNGALDDRTLAEALPKTDTPEFFLLLEQLKELERGIRLRYAAEGYLGATIGVPVTRYDEASKTFHIEIPIQEGPLTRVSRVSFGGELAIDTEKLREVFGVTLGEPVDFPEIRRGQSAIRTLYRENGFPDVKLRAAMERTEEGLEIHVAIQEGAPARVGQVRIIGNRRTRASVIRNELTFGPGDPIRLTDFQQSQKRLYDLAIFRSADVRPDPSQQGQEVQDILIQVVERSDLDVNYGLRYNAVTSEQTISSESEPKASGLEVVARVNLINQIGRGTNLGFSIFFQPNHRLLRGTLRLPTFLGKRVVTEVTLETERNDEELGGALMTRSEAVTFQQTKKLTDDRYQKFAIQWNFRFVRIRGIFLSEEGTTLIDFDTTRPRFGVSFIEDRRDSFANPTRGRFWNITFQGVPKIWGSDLGYIRLYGQFFYYYPLFKEWIWASGIRMGLATGTSEILLTDDRFLAGGANSVRGFRQNALGPSITLPETGERIFVGGQAVAVWNQELRFPIYKLLHGGVYWDAGNVFTTAGQFRLSDLRHSVGAGLRFVLPFGALRFDWAEALNAQINDETTRWHFSFGYAF